LSVVVEEQGLSSAEGRAAALELSRMYLYQYTEKSDQAYKYLSELIDYRQKDPGAAAEAYYLMGEYYTKQNKPEEAAESFARAAVVGTGDDDLVARSLLKAAKSALAAGDTRGARSMVRKLETEFPNTQWVAEGKQLLENKGSN